VKNTSLERLLETCILYLPNIGYCDWNRVTSISLTDKSFLLSKVVQTGSGAHLASYPMCTGDTFLEGKEAGELS
jgi:hypothetical protein